MLGIPFIFKLFLSEGQGREVWKPFNKAMIFPKNFIVFIHITNISDG